MQYDRMAKHIGHNTVTKPPPHAKGWRLLSKSQWLQRKDATVCVVGATARDFIEWANSCSQLHPINGAFAEGDHERLAHPLHKKWIWSNNEKANHMHGWVLLTEMPANAKQLVISLPQDSEFAPDVRTRV